MGIYTYLGLWVVATVVVLVGIPYGIFRLKTLKIYAKRWMIFSKADFRLRRVKNEVEIVSIHTCRTPNTWRRDIGCRHQWVAV